MSILQDYEEAREMIGTEKYDAIKKYLDIVCPQEKCDKYYEELKKYNNLLVEEQTHMHKKLAEKMNIVLLSDVLYKKEEWDKFDKWYNEDYLHRRVEILNIWVDSNNDNLCNATLYQNNKLIANVVINITDYIIDTKNNNNINYSDFLKSIIYNEFKKYSKLPKVSKCSKLLQEIYRDVCDSEASMCYITDEDWKESYSDNYTIKDIENLKQEVKRLKLDDVVTFNDGEYKILGWGDLRIKLNDDREFNKNKERER